MARRTQLWQALGLAIIHAAHSTLVAHYSFDDGTAAEDSDASLDGTIEGATGTEDSRRKRSVGCGPVWRLLVAG